MTTLASLFGKFFGEPQRTQPVSHGLDPDYYVRTILELPTDAFSIIMPRIKPAEGAKRDLRVAIFPGQKHSLRNPNHPLIKAWLYMYAHDKTSNTVWIEFNPIALDSILTRDDLMQQLRTRADAEGIAYFK